MKKYTVSLLVGIAIATHHNALVSFNLGQKAQQAKQKALEAAQQAQAAAQQAQQQAQAAAQQAQQQAQAAAQQVQQQAQAAVQQAQQQIQKTTNSISAIASSAATPFSAETLKKIEGILTEKIDDLKEKITAFQALDPKAPERTFEGLKLSLLTLSVEQELQTFFITITQNLKNNLDQLKTMVPGLIADVNLDSSFATLMETMRTYQGIAQQIVVNVTTPLLNELQGSK